MMYCGYGAGPCFVGPLYKDEETYTKYRVR